MGFFYSSYKDIKLKLAQQTERRRQRAIQAKTLKQSSSKNHVGSRNQNNSLNAHLSATRNPVSANHSLASFTSSNISYESYNSLQHSDYGQQTYTVRDEFPVGCHLSRATRLNHNSNYSNCNSSLSSPGYKKVVHGSAPAHGLTIQELKEMTRARLASETSKYSDTRSYSSHDFNDAHSLISSQSNPITRKSINLHEPIRRRLRSLESNLPSNSNLDFRSTRYYERGYPGSISSSVFHDDGLYIEAGDNGSVNSFMSGLSESVTHASDMSGRNFHFDRSVSEDFSECSDYFPPHHVTATTYKTKSSPFGLRNLHEDRPLSADPGGIDSLFSADNFFDPKYQYQNNLDFSSFDVKPSSVLSSKCEHLTPESHRKSNSTSSTYSFDSAVSSSTFDNGERRIKVLSNSVDGDVINPSDSYERSTIQRRSTYFPPNNSTESKLCCNNEGCGDDIDQLLSKINTDLNIFGGLGLEASTIPKNARTGASDIYDWKAVGSHKSLDRNVRHISFDS